MLSTSALLEIGEWLIRLSMIPIVAMRKANPTVCLAWLSVIFLSPWVGLVAYLFLGENKLGRRRLKSRLRRQREFVASRHRPARLPDYEHPGVREGHELLVKLAENHGGMSLIGGNTVDFTADHETIDRLVADIDAARHHVHLLFYMYAADDWAGEVTGALARAVARGVECRLLVDDAGSRKTVFGLSEKLKDKGIRLVSCLPVSPLRMHLARIDIRNHRKIAVIDGRLGYAGSQNIVRPEGHTRRAGTWQDVMARIEGPAVSHLQMVFIQDWFFETGEILEADEYYPAAEGEGQAAVQVVPTGPDLPTEGFQDMLVHAIHAARERIVITTPYFIPNQSLLTALRLASARGVDVEVMVPDKSDHPLVDLATSFFCGQVARSGARVLLFQAGFLHAKIMTVDDTLSMIGSANFDMRSFYLDLELVLFLYDRESTTRLSRIQARYREHAVPLEPEARRPVLRALGESIAKVLSPLL